MSPTTARLRHRFGTCSRGIRLRVCATSCLGWDSPQELQRWWFHDCKPVCETRYSNLSTTPSDQLPVELDSLLRELEDAAAASRHLELNHSESDWRAAASVVASSAHRFLTFVRQDPGILPSLQASAACDPLPQNVMPSRSSSRPSRCRKHFLANQLLFLLEEKRMLVAQGSGLHAAAELQERRSGELLALMARSRGSVPALSVWRVYLAVTVATFCTPQPAT